MSLSLAKSAKIHLAVLSAASIALTGYFATPAHAAVVVKWTFDGLTANTTGAATGPFTADVNPGSITANATALHASATTVYSVPAGNGSLHSLSSNQWAINDYYEFDLDTSSVPDALDLDFDALGSATGPRDFKVQYNIGAGWVDLPGGSYVITSAPTWSTATASTNPAQSYHFTLAGLIGLTGVRLTDIATVSVTGGVIGTAGTSRVDNVTFSTPEPATASVVAAGAAFILGRRRRR